MMITRLATHRVVAAGMAALSFLTFQLAAQTSAIAQNFEGRGHKPGARGPQQPHVRLAPRVVAPRIAVPHVQRHSQPNFVPQVARRPHPPTVNSYRYAAPAHRPPPVRYDRGRGRGWGWGPGIAIGAGALILGGAAYSERHRSTFEQCAARFDSFDWDDGTIENEDGERELCPYLE